MRTNSWGHFSRYEVEGDHIRPSRHASWKAYDPWDGWEAVNAKQRGGGMLERPYLELVELGDWFAEDDKRASRPVAEAMKTPLGWCGRYGLLGLMLRKVRQITPYPRWERDEETEEVWPGSRTYVRSALGWTLAGGVYASLEARELSSPERRKKRGDVVARGLWEPSWDEPSVLIENRETGRIEKEPVGMLREYFPSIAAADQEVYDYPLPLSAEFWRSYAEPVGEFQECVRSFARHVRTVGRYGAGGPLSAEAKIEFQAAALALTALAAETVRVLNSDSEGQVQSGWLAPSLIGTYASMALSDAVHGLLNVCDQCERVFVSSSGRARFCSTLCRKTRLQRE